MTDTNATPALLPCEHCGCRYGYHEQSCPALVDEIVSVAVTGFKADVERIMAEHPETKPGDMTREQQCMMVAEASGWRTRALKAEAELARRTPPPTTDDGEREAVARAIAPLVYATVTGNDVGREWEEMPEYVQDIYFDAADAALSALAPYRTTELATEYARGLADGVKQSEAAIVAAHERGAAEERARVVALVRQHAKNQRLDSWRCLLELSADAIERREHAQEAGE